MFLKTFFTELFTLTPTENHMATITPLDNGRFALVDRSGTFIQDYARERDAVRGASRRGLAVA